MASNNVLCKLIMLILVTIIFASNNVATRNLLSMSHLAHVKHDEMNNTSVPAPNPPKSPPEDGPWDDPWDGNF
ncbi:hypothetical protein IC582_017192 [Cucumis melo]|uniref:Transmembrane protein n=2 Tax=Cucumis melo TaxID=3656 RepID=A0A5A7TMV8_CUCMM|nr:hypothetical protein E6C27_scaffold46G003970 [Cucumis melo var. makuwa]TYK16946.1 hypothetical protein E5676_scaffold130G00830 [Cucumis melo var. makuwa]